MESPRKPRRSKEEIAAETAEAQAKRDAAIADMRELCAKAAGAPCSQNCTRKCYRRELDRKNGVRRKRQQEAENQKVADSVQRRIDQRATEEAERLAAIRFEDRERKSRDHALEKWKTQVLFLVGYASKHIAERIYGKAERYKEIDRTVRAHGLREVTELRPRVHKLLELQARAPHGFRGYVDASAAHGPIKGLYDEVVRVRGTVPEFDLKVEKTRLGERHWNAGSGASALQAIARTGSLSVWNVQAAQILQGYHERVQASTIGSPDYSGDIIDGGGGDTEGSEFHWVHAANQIRAARRAVEAEYEIQGTGPWRWAVIDHVVLRDQPLRTFACPAGMTSRPALFLNDALESVAHVFGTVPAGIPRRAPTTDDQARHLLREAIDAHRIARLVESGDARGSVPVRNNKLERLDLDQHKWRESWNR